MNKIKFLSVLLIATFVFNVANPVFAKDIVMMDDGSYSSQPSYVPMMTPSEANKKSEKSVNVSGQHKVEGIKRYNDKYYISFSVDQKQFWVEVTKEEDKNVIDAYDRKDLGLYVVIPEGAEAKEGVVSQYTNIFNPDSINPTHHASDIKVNGLTVTDIHKETVKIPTGRVPIEKEMYVGTVTTETGRKIYVEVPEEYVGKNITVSINISDKEYVNYYRDEKEKHIVPKENVKFEVNTTNQDVVIPPADTTKFDDGKIISYSEYNGRYFARVESQSNKGSIRLELSAGLVDAIETNKISQDAIVIKKTKDIVPEKIDNMYVIHSDDDGLEVNIIADLIDNKTNNSITEEIKVEQKNDILKNVSNNVRGLLDNVIIVNKNLQDKIITNLNNSNEKNLKEKIQKQYGKDGLTKITKLAKAIPGYNTKKIYNMLLEKKISKKQLNEIYNEIKKIKKTAKKDLKNAILNSQIIDKYSKNGLTKITEIAKKINGYNTKRVYNLLIKNKISAKQLNEVYKEVKTKRKITKKDLMKIISDVR